MLNVFLQESMISELSKLEANTASLDCQDAVIELISMPLRCVVMVEGSCLDVKVYIRDEKLTDTTLYRSGRFPIGEPIVVPEEDQTAAHYAIAYCRILSVLKEQGILESCGGMDESREGILLSGFGGKIQVKRVSERNRPALKCQLRSGGIQMVKPYEYLPEEILHQSIPTEERKKNAEFARMEEQESEGIYEQNYDALEAADTKPSLLWELSYIDAVFDLEEDTATVFDVLVTQEAKTVYIGDAVSLICEQGGKQAVLVKAENGQELGWLSPKKCAVLAPLMNGGFAESITAVISAVTPILGVERSVAVGIRMVVHFDSLTQCTVCKLGGDQVGVWSQELTVYHCTLPLQDAKALFELHNRFHREYDNMDQGILDTSYAGLDNLEEEILEARKKMQAERNPEFDYSAGDVHECAGFGAYVLRKTAEEPLRYGGLVNYEISEYCRLDEILERYCLAEEKHYWLDQTVVPEEIFAECEGSEYWYEILELYEGKQLPVDLHNEETVSILGCGCFAAFADLSYGC